MVGGMTWPSRARHKRLLAQISAVWAEVLQREHISPTNNFLALGGNSLQAVQIVGRVEELVGVHLPVRCLLETRTIDEMAEHVRRAIAAQGGRPDRR
jgi:acyl carrier protein